ncbi:ECF transporter S component [Amedibacillus sp. YH-ame10]
MKSQVKNISLSSMFLAMGIILPMAFHWFTFTSGAVFLPMHIPVLLCGFLCGPFYGALVGILTPLLSSVLTGMPMLMPVGVSMMFELMTYGILSGICVKRFRIYPSLILTMLAGRAVSGVVTLVLLSFTGKAYTLAIFIGSAFVTAFPGIVLQLLVVPFLVRVVMKIRNQNGIHKI